jgi:putative transposase
MVRYRRLYIPGGTYFFTLTLADRRATLLVDHITALRQAFRTTKARAPFTINAIVILPDHLHVLMTLPEDDPAFSNRLRQIKVRFTRDLLATGLDLMPDASGEYRLWQHRYWEHAVRDEADLANHIAYIHINPVKHGLVDRVADWPHSSFHRFVRQGLIPRDWAGTLPAAETGFGE